METELTYDEAELLIEARLRKHPELRAILLSEHLDETLIQILDFVVADHSLLPEIKDEIVVILALYAPLNELAQNIAESTGLSPEKAENIASLIETLILQPVYNDLLAYQYLWMEELKKEAVAPEVPTEMNEMDTLPPVPIKVATPLPTPVAEIPKAPPVATLGTVPDVSNDLRERLELRPKTVIRQTFSEPKVEESDEDDDGPKPLTRTQILQSLTSKRTMASDIASIHKSGDTDTHT